MDNLKLNKTVSEIKPWRKVLDMTLIILCWLTIAPLMSALNRYETYFSRKQLIWLTIFSPFTWSLFTILFLVLGVPIISSNFPSLAHKLDSFPEFIHVFDSPGGWLQFLLVIYLLPVYSFCVLFLLLSVALTGYSYITVSVYICEYFQPWFCIGVAIFVVMLSILNMKRMNLVGKFLSVVPILLELIMAYSNYYIFRSRVILYRGMDDSQIFHTVVKTLVAIGDDTHTNYITANVILYILPLVAVLAVGFLAWVIYTVTRVKTDMQG